MESTKEPQYQTCLEIRDRQGLTPLGLMANQTWHDDPKRLLFVLSRYKFVSKILTGKTNVLEVGCADAFGTRIVCQAVDKVTAIDFDPVFIDDTNERADPKWPFEARVHDMLTGPVKPGNYDAAYSMDVLEHINPSDEDRFIKNVSDSLTEDGELIIGSPSIHSQPHASPASKAGHVNCKDQDQLRALMAKHFRHVFLFSMNDEVVHTGFGPMSHYLLAVCCGKL